MQNLNNQCRRPDYPTAQMTSNPTSHYYQLYVELDISLGLGEVRLYQPLRTVL